MKGKKKAGKKLQIVIKIKTPISIVSMCVFIENQNM